MIDHATLLRPRARLRAPAYLIAVALAACATVAVVTAVRIHQDAAALVLANERLHARQTAARPQPGKQDAEFQRQWAVLLQERTFPWSKVFRAVEHVVDPEIELLEFRPDRRQGTLILKGEGRNAESVMRYLGRLQEDATFSRVYLAHTASVQRGRLETRSFELRLYLDGTHSRPR